MEFSYDWLAALTAVLSIFTLMFLGRNLVFSIPAIAENRKNDKAENKLKWQEKSKKYHPRVVPSQKIGMGFNLAFYVLVLPFIVSFETQGVGRILLDCFAILMIYDFFYYMTHRFLFHGEGFFRRVHAVHHQARTRVSSIDSYLLHPVEIFIGVSLFAVVTTVYALAMGSPFNVVTIIITSLIYTNLNQINHCHINLEGFPWKTLNWIAMKHDAHHIDMHRGNYATISLFYDWLFRTVERHPREDEMDKANSA